MATAEPISIFLCYLWVNMFAYNHNLPQYQIGENFFLGYHTSLRVINKKMRGGAESAPPPVHIGLMLVLDLISIVLRDQQNAKCFLFPEHSLPVNLTVFLLRLPYILKYFELLGILVYTFVCLKHRHYWKRKTQLQYIPATS